MSWLRTPFLTLCLILQSSSACLAQAPIVVKVPGHVWQGLSQGDKHQVGARYVVDVIPSESLGVIIDVQGVDRSDPGTTGGQQLGAAMGSAAYIDKAFKGTPDYSAKSHLGASLFGAIIGSALDRPSSAKYQYRYSVKTLANKIEYLDEYSTEPFRKSLGACVLIPLLSPVSQDLCSETDNTFKQKYLSRTETPAERVYLDAPTLTKEKGAVPVQSTQPQISALVRCKFGLNPAVMVEREACHSAKGEILP